MSTTQQTPVQTPRGNTASSAGRQSRNSSAARSSSAASRTRSRSGDRGSIAFGRATPTPKKRWETSSFIDESPTPSRPHPTQLHVATIDEVCALDSITMGSASGSVRLQRYVPAVGPRTTYVRARTPFSLQEPVTITVETGTVEIRKASTDHQSRTVICTLPIDSISKVEMTSGGVACSGRGGLEVLLTIHAETKQVMLYKLLSAKIKGLIPATNAEVEANTKATAPENPALTSAPSHLLRDSAIRARIKAVDTADVITRSRSANKAGSTSPITATSSAAAGGQEKLSTLNEDRQNRREVLYAQLRQIRQRSAAK